MHAVQFRVVEVRHPLVRHKLGLLRDIATGPALFRQLVGEIATLLAYEATADLALEDVAIGKLVYERALERGFGKTLEG